MNPFEYQKLVKKCVPVENRFKNALVAFLSGGFLGMLCQLGSEILSNCFSLSINDSYALICMLLIIITSFLTALGVFDNFIKIFRCGLIIPTTGFAHSVSSAALEYKKDGMITGLGSNFFKLAGSVILYGMVSAFFFSILWVIIYG